MVNQPKLNKNHHGAASAQFPGKLHDMISFAEEQGLSHIISFVQGGTAIMVHDPDRLLEMLPHFGFSQTQYRSFQRQLNMWHFERILEGQYKSAWMHPCFVRGNKALCSLMSRHGVPPNADAVRAMIASSKKLSMQQTNSPLLQTDSPKLILSPKPCSSFPQPSYPEKLLLTPKLNLRGLMDLPLNRGCGQLFLERDCTLATAKFICNVDEDAWAPLPADTPFLDESMNSSKEELDFLERLQPTLFSLGTGVTVEPTPLREPPCSATRFIDPNSDMSQLLEPISGLDDIF